ncbi:nuclear transport factor 2 family protein [Gramella jeungdoensis]|uniref:Nuclear transport factor 2 family protein n=1 Tax=Gramella jeungdoensis TaxID=708091 RepID=A0ABT0YXM3_9FLAO|nr:nuclear transport factor 2 family protein [Gramella jeungdoensis]MCM8568220.1 nuclear transport factor 2 family protein [Gramella jeungdoensis]
MKKQFMLLIAAIFIGFTGFAQKSTSAREIVQNNSRMMEKAMANGDFETFGSYFTEDAMFKISNHNPLSGREAITEAHKDMKGIQLSIETEEVLDFGDYIHEIGSYELNTPDGKKMDHGYYSTLWKKVDGNWKIYRDVISSSTPMPAPPSN